MIFKNTDGTYSEAPTSPFDPTTAATDYLQAVSALNLSTSEQQAKLTSLLVDQTATVKAMLVKLQAVMVQFPETQAIIQPQIDAANSQFPSIVATLK